MRKDNAFIQEQDAIKKNIQRKLKTQKKCQKIDSNNSSGKQNKNPKKQE